MLIANLLIGKFEFFSGFWWAAISVITIRNLEARPAAVRSAPKTSFFAASVALVRGNMEITMFVVV